MIREDLVQFFEDSGYKTYKTLSQRAENKIRKIAENVDIKKVIAFKDLSTLFKIGGYVFCEDYIYAGSLKIKIEGLKLFEYISDGNYRYSYGNEPKTVKLGDDIGNQIAKFIDYINELETKGVQYYKNQDYENAFKCLKVPAYYNRFDAVNYLSLCYEFGAGTEKNIEKAISLYKSIFPYDEDEFKKAEKLIEVGDISYNNGCFLRSYVAYIEADKKGSKIAPYYIGYLYHYGKGFAQNDDEALKWYKKALDRGLYHKKLHYNLALLYRKQKNYIETVRHLEECSEEDSCYLEGLMYYNGEYYIQNLAQARKLLEIASRKKTTAFYHIAKIAKEKGDYQGHFDNLVKGYEANDKLTINLLAKAYEEGTGCSVDLKKAYELYQEGSQYYFECSVNLARFYNEGIYVKKDVNKALEILNKCVSNGYKEAYAEIAKIYINKSDYRKAVEILSKKEAKDSVQCAVLLADCYVNGFGVSKAPSTAYSLLKQWITKESGELAKLALMKYAVNKKLNLSFADLKDMIEIVAVVISHDPIYKNTLESFKKLYKDEVINKYVRGRKFEGEIQRYDGTYRDCVYLYKEGQEYYFMDVENYEVLSTNVIAIVELKRNLKNINCKLEVGINVKYRGYDGRIHALKVIY